MSRYNISEKRKKSKFRPITNRLPVLLLCLLVFWFLSKASWNAYKEKRRSGEAALTAKTELAKLEQRQAFIREELNQSATQEGMEAKLREKFGLGRPGEQVAIIVEEKNGDDNTLSGNGFLQKVKEFFKSLFRK